MPDIPSVDGCPPLPLLSLRSGFDDPQATPVSPCKVYWDGMKGDDRIRQCGTCKLGVYNVTGMSFEEAQALVSETEGVPCKKLYRRPDGTILAQDCPVRLEHAAQRLSVMAGALAAAIAALAMFGALPLGAVKRFLPSPPPERAAAVRNGSAVAGEQRNSSPKRMGRQKCPYCRTEHCRRTGKWGQTRSMR